MGGADVAGIELVYGGYAEQAHGDGEFFFEDLEHTGYAGLSVGG